MATMYYGEGCQMFCCVFVLKSLFFISPFFCSFPQIEISCTSPASPPKPVQTQSNVDKTTFVNERCYVKYLNILVSCVSLNLSALGILVMSFSLRSPCSLSGSLFVLQELLSFGLKFVLVGWLHKIVKVFIIFVLNIPGRLGWFSHVTVLGRMLFSSCRYLLRLCLHRFLGFATGHGLWF